MAICKAKLLGVNGVFVSIFASVTKILNLEIQTNFFFIVLVKQGAGRAWSFYLGFHQEPCPAGPCLTIRCRVDSLCSFSFDRKSIGVLLSAWSWRKFGSINSYVIILFRPQGIDDDIYIKSREICERFYFCKLMNQSNW